MPGFSECFGFFWFFWRGRGRLGSGRVIVLGRWRDGWRAVVSRRRAGDGVPRSYILGISSVAMGEVVARPASCVGGCFVASVAFFFFKKVRGASRSGYAGPGGPPRPESQAVPGEEFSRAVTSRSDLARRRCTSALVALRGGCPLSRAVRRPALAVTVSSVIRGGDEPLSELSVLARKRSGDRGDLSFPVVTGIG